MKRQPRSARQGSLLICVLVCMGIASAITLTSVRASLRVRRQMRQEWQLEQTRWLLQSGIARGMSGLEQSPAYQGETWQISPAIDSYAEAVVEITVTNSGTGDLQKKLNVTATIRDQGPSAKPTRRSESVIVQE